MPVISKELSSLCNLSIWIILCNAVLYNSEWRDNHNPITSVRRVSICVCYERRKIIWEPQSSGLNSAMECLTQSILESRLLLRANGDVEWLGLWTLRRFPVNLVSSELRAMAEGGRGKGDVIRATGRKHDETFDLSPEIMKMKGRTAWDGIFGFKHSECCLAAVADVGKVWVVNTV